MDSIDISVNYLLCSECNYEWRSKKAQRCPNCQCSMGVRCVLEAPQIEALMKAVNENSYGVNSEDEITFVISELSKSWAFVSMALIAQACWVYLRDQPSTLEIKKGLKYFKEVFLDSV